MKTVFFNTILFAIFLACTPSNDAQVEILDTPTISSTDDVNDEPQKSDVHGDPETASINILFVGNSLTYSNDLPKLVYEFAKTKNTEISTKMIAKPNYAIIDHLDFGSQVRNEIDSKKYDFVVVQQGPFSQSEGRQLLFEAGERFSVICEANDAKLVFFMVWPARANYHTFNGVIKNHTEVAKTYNAILAPVGEQWKTHFDETGDFSYYGPDQFHPSLEGSTAAAKIILASLQKSL